MSGKVLRQGMYHWESEGGQHGSASRGRAASGTDTAREAGRGVCDGIWLIQEGEAAKGLEAQEEHSPVSL